MTLPEAISVAAELRLDRMPVMEVQLYVGRGNDCGEETDCGIRQDMNVSLRGRAETMMTLGADLRAEVGEGNVCGDVGQPE